MSLLVRGGRLVTPEGVDRADLLIKGGQIAQVAPEILDAAGETLDATGLHIFPGLIDAHVHFNEPGRTDWEGFATGSAALAAGGGTTFIDMPLNSAPTLGRASFLAKKEAAEASSLTDFALWGGLTPANLDCLGELAECGAVGFKAFMSDSGMSDFRAADDLTLYRGMEMAAKLGLPVAVHAESEALTKALTLEGVSRGQTAVRDYLDSRPIIAELEAISRALLFAEETGADLHIVHVSTARGVALITEAKKRGVRVTCETCPHYLHFTDEDTERMGAVLKCAPPLRSDEERQALWRAVLTGELDLVASDHSPSPPELKEGNDFFKVWGGIAGVQSSLNVLLDGHEARGMPLANIARLTSLGPAERFGLGGKGKLELSSDADFSLVDLSAATTLAEADLFTRHKLSPYVSQTLRGEVRRTVQRGETLYLDGKLGQTRGQLLKPSQTQL